MYKIRQVSTAQQDQICRAVSQTWQGDQSLAFDRDPSYPQYCAWLWSWDGAISSPDEMTAHNREMSTASAKLAKLLPGLDVGIEYHNGLAIGWTFRPKDMFKG